ncbi:MAG: Outer membrane vitamin B12 receptor BtuB, partial [uncultured Acetobacteraceae bacterium]
ATSDGRPPRRPHRPAHRHRRDRAASHRLRHHRHRHPRPDPGRAGAGLHHRADPPGHRGARLPDAHGGADRRSGCPDRPTRRAGAAGQRLLSRHEQPACAGVAGRGADQRPVRAERRLQLRQRAAVRRGADRGAARPGFRPLRLRGAGRRGEPGHAAGAARPRLRALRRTGRGHPAHPARGRGRRGHGRRLRLPAVRAVLLDPRLQRHRAAPARRRRARRLPRRLHHRAPRLDAGAGHADRGPAALAAEQLRPRRRAAGRSELLRGRPALVRADPGRDTLVRRRMDHRAAHSRDRGPPAFREPARHPEQVHGGRPVPRHPHHARLGQHGALAVLGRAEGRRARLRGHPRFRGSAERQRLALLPDHRGRDAAHHRRLRHLAVPAGGAARHDGGAAPRRHHRLHGRDHVAARRGAGGAGNLLAPPGVRGHRLRRAVLVPALRHHRQLLPRQPGPAARALHRLGGRRRNRLPRSRARGLRHHLRHLLPEPHPRPHQLQRGLQHAHQRGPGAHPGRGAGADPAPRRLVRDDGGLDDHRRLRRHHRPPPAPPAGAGGEHHRAGGADPAGGGRADRALHRPEPGRRLRQLQRPGGRLPLPTQQPARHGRERDRDLAGLRPSGAVPRSAQPRQQPLRAGERLRNAGAERAGRHALRAV